MLFALALIPRAAAVLCHDGTTTSVDADADGWCVVDTPNDCDDGGSGGAINPNAAEDGIDDVDDDCDGSVLVHRIFSSEMSSLIDTPFVRAAAVSQVTAGGEDVVHFAVHATISALTLRPGHEMDFGNGEFHVVLRVAAKTGSPTCAVEVTSTNMTLQSQNFSATVGTHVFSFPDVWPGDEITHLKVSCPSGSGTMDLDWMTVQNGPYRFGAMGDISAGASTMGLPGVARQSLVRSSVASDGVSMGALAFVGSEQGGFGWSAGGDVWKTANGTAGQWFDFGQGGVWEAWALDNEGSLADQSVTVLTGNKDTAADGGLWHTSHLDTALQQWTLIDDTIGAAKHIDDCDPSAGSKPISSGKLIVADPADTNNLLVASQVADPDYRGLWVWNGVDPIARPYFNASLPAGALPSALAIDSSGYYLLVGYHVITGTEEHTALYVCPASFAAVSGEDCVPISIDEDAVWAADVRDIEADPIVDALEEPIRPGVFYVADGGRRGEDESTVCDVGESTVFKVTVSGTFPSTTQSIIDTDDAVDDPPDWMDAGTEYYDVDACNDNNATAEPTLGNLVPPKDTGEGSELSSITVDPLGRWLFAYFPLNDRTREYGCVRNFRVLTGDIAEEGTPWEPFQSWEFGAMAYDSPTHPLERRAHVDAQGALMSSEPLLEDWAGAGTHDAAFVQGSGEEPDLLLGGNFLWRVFPESASTASGWDTETPLTALVPDYTGFDLDDIDWTLAWDGAGRVFQDATVNAISSCPGCKQESLGTVDLVLASGLSDYKLATLFGKYGATRQAAQRPCEVHKLNAGGIDVSMWTEGAAMQAWLPLVSQSHDDDSDRARALLFTEDVTTNAWCWDGVEVGANQFAAPAYATDLWTDPSTPGTDGIWELHCQDSSAVIPQWWDACNADEPTNPFNLGVSGVGHIKRVAAFDDSVALLAAAPGQPITGGTAAGEGAWMATYAAPTGIEYAKIPWPGGDLTWGTGSCLESEFFAFESQVAMVVSPQRDPGDDRVVAFLTSKHADCGVVELHFDEADPSGDYDWYPISLGACTLDTDKLRGVSITRDAHWLFAYGGPDDGAYSDGGICAIDLTNSNAAEQAISGADMDFEIHAVLPHPHLDDIFFAAGLDADDINSVEPAGVYIFQHRYLADIDEWRWSSRLLSGSDLEHRRVTDIDWGSGDASFPASMSHLYAATGGGGVWDLTLTKE